MVEEQEVVGTKETSRFGTKCEMEVVMLEWLRANGTALVESVYGKEATAKQGIATNRQGRWTRIETVENTESLKVCAAKCFVSFCLI